MNQNFKKGDIIIFKAEEDDWLSQAIGYLTNSDASHAAMVYSDDSIIEVGAPGICVNKTAISDGDTVYVMRLVSEPDSAPLIRSADAYLKSGVGYDFAGLFILAGLLVDRKIIPTPKLLSISNKILYAASLGLDDLIHHISKHPTDKVMVCSQLIYQIFYDCGGEYRIQIENGTFVNDMLTDTLPQSIRLADYIDIDTESEQTCFEQQAKQDSIYPHQDPEYLMKQLYQALSEPAENQDFIPIENNIKSSNTLSNTIHLASDFLSNVKRLLAVIDSDMTPASLFITPADLVYHAVNLKKVGTLHLERVLK